jgi:hypothetical protein
MTVIISKIIQFTYFEMSHLQSQYRWQYICSMQHVQSFWTSNKGQKSNVVVTSLFKFMLTFCSIYPLSHMQLGFKIYYPLGYFPGVRPFMRKRNKNQKRKWYTSVCGDMTQWSLKFNVKHQHLQPAYEGNSSRWICGGSLTYLHGLASFSILILTPQQWHLETLNVNFTHCNVTHYIFALRFIDKLPGNLLQPMANYVRRLWLDYR